MRWGNVRELCRQMGGWCGVLEPKEECVHMGERPVWDVTHLISFPVCNQSPIAMASWSSLLLLSLQLLKFCVFKPHAEPSSVYTLCSSCLGSDILYQTTSLNGQHAHLAILWYLCQIASIHGCRSQLIWILITPTGPSFVWTRLSLHLDSEIPAKVSSCMGTVMAKFMYHLDWVVRCPDIWINIIFGCVCESGSRWNWHLNLQTE